MPAHLYTDNLSLIMAVIIGIVGGLIAIFAVPYMREFHQKHREVKDRRGFFFAVIFLFLGAMFGIVFSDHLLWLYFFWEITTLCSFLLIGYKGNQESVNNAFRALILNLVGSLGFVIAIYVFFYTNRSVSLAHLIASPTGFTLIPAAALAFAGLAKAAQMPFSSWLLGAMVAPTPVSALLHSSTMVKAGVFLILKLATAFGGTVVGTLVASVGAVTFLGTSLMAIAQNDAKKVLAYSTIANLGLIVFCAGIGTAWAIWAAVLLIVFHAITKCLLFLCVGALENKSGSRDIERMDALIARAPLLSLLMLAGMAGMFILPFGMLVSKWAVLKTLVLAQPVMTGFVAFGSAATAFFWLKWMGRLISVPAHPTECLAYTWDEKLSLSILVVLMILACAFFYQLSVVWVAPYIEAVTGFGLPPFGINNLGTIIGLLVLVLFLPLILDLFKKGTSRQVGPYLSGANSPDRWQYQGAQDAAFGISNRNYYLTPYFGEQVLFRPTLVISIVLLVVMAVSCALLPGGGL
jgi:ech hydrogenase subunit A